VTVGVLLDGELGALWGARRPQPRIVHLDSAAAGRQSLAVLRATADHALLEAQAGAYVAEAEASATLDAGRATLASLFGVEPDGVAFVPNATAALAALLRYWSLPAGATVAVAPSEWGSNLQAFRVAGLTTATLAVDALGLIDLDALQQLLAMDPPDVVHLTQVASHRPLVQPVAEVAALCRAAGVPLWVDAAQALGHVDVATGADASYAVSRKWMTGPRGIGVLAIAQRAWSGLTVEAPVMHPQLPTVRRLEPTEATISGRVGFCTAVAQYVDDGPQRMHDALRVVGNATRSVLSELSNWQIIDAGTTASAITALRPLAGQSVATTRARLLDEFGILTTVSLAVRAPLELTEPLLRVSPHVDVTVEVLENLRRALAQI
jgi:pyridoxal 5-phosphate dependent beta-lyase